MRWRSIQSNSQSGFTLIEMVTVIVLIGILSVFVAPRMLDMGAVNARGLQDETLAFLRYAQKSAVAQRRVVCLAFTSRTVTIHVAATSGFSTCDTPMRGPTGDSPGMLTAKGGADYSAVPADFNFNGLGQPVNASGVVLTTSQILQVNNVSGPVTVEAVTGYVHE